MENWNNWLDIPFDLLTEPIPVHQAVRLAILQTYSIITSSINGLYHIVAGNISTCNLSGPVEIAEISSHMARKDPKFCSNFGIILSRHWFYESITYPSFGRRPPGILCL